MNLRLAFGLSVLVLVLFGAGCSSPPAQTVRQQTEMGAVSWGDVERVSVLTSDGQEIPLDAKLFSEFSAKYETNSEELHASSLPLSADDVRFTVIVYRRVEAPLVIEVGQGASQIGDVTYRGAGADRFYHWVRESLGQSLFAGEHVPSVEAAAIDMKVSVAMGPAESSEIWSILKQAEYRKAPHPPQHPLYPHYHLKLRGEESEMEVTVLTPSLLLVRLGKEELHFAVTEPLFSRLIERIPPKPETPPFDPMFKATALSVHDRTGQIGGNMRKVADSIAAQGTAHELVRLFKQSIPAQVPPHGQASLSLTFAVGADEHTVRVYKDHVELNGELFSHPGIEQKARDLLATLPE